MEEIWVKHYSSRHKMLLVGEGDFSFAACLASAFGNASNMTATSLDSKEELEAKHPTAAANLSLIISKGGAVMHGVDAHTMSRHPQLGRIKFDRIVFNFPHAPRAICLEHTSAQISLHKELVQGFFNNACKMMSQKEGQVLVTHKTAYPFSEWEIQKLAETSGFYLAEEVDFDISEYSGYVNKKGYGRWTNSSFPVGRCSTFKFAILSCGLL